MPSTPSTTRHTTLTHSIDIGALKSGADDSLESDRSEETCQYDQIYQVFYDKHTKSLYPRQLALLKKVIRVNQNGYKIKDLPHIQKIMKATYEQYQSGQSQFLNPLCQMVQLCQQPFHRLKANEEFTLPDSIPSIVYQLAELLQSIEPELQRVSTEALFCISTGQCLMLSVEKGEVESVKTKTRTEKATKTSVLRKEATTTAVENAPTSATGASSAYDLRQSARDYSQAVLHEAGVVEIACGVLNSLIEFALNDPIVSVDQENDQTFSSEEGLSKSSEAHDTPAPGEVSENSKAVEEVANATTVPSESVQSPETLDVIDRMEVLLFPIMDLLRELSCNHANASIFAEMQALESILQILDTVHDLNDDLLPVCIEILWNVLENYATKIYPKYREAAPTTTSRRELLSKYRDANPYYHLCNTSTLTSLCQLLELFLKQGYRQQFKALRNECLILIVLLTTAKCVKYAPSFSTQAIFEAMYDSNLLQCLMKYGFGAEAGMDLALDYHNFIEAGDLDFEFKQLIWYLLTCLCSREGEYFAHAPTKAIASSLLEYPFFQVLLMYILHDTTDSRIVHQWSSTQLHVLQQEAIALLLALTRHFAPAFQEQHGPTALLECLKTCRDETLAKQMAFLMLAVCRVDPEIPVDLGNLGAIDVMLEIIKDDQRPIELRSHAASVLAELGRENIPNQERFRKLGGVFLLHEHLQFSVSDQVIKKNFIFTIVDAIWSCIAGNTTNKTQFLHHEGMSSLLDLLTACPAVMQNQVLGLLTDLCKNPKARLALQGWRNPQKGESAVQLLLMLWKQEEARLKVERPDTGILQNLHCPLQEQGLENAGAAASSPFAASITSSTAFTRLIEALQAAQGMKPTLSGLQQVVHKCDQRMKIYCLLCRIGFGAISIKRLKIDEQITLALVKEYPHFRMGEFWRHVKQELHHFQVRPIFQDALLIEKQLEKAFNIAIKTKFDQTQLHQLRLQHQSQQEQAFFQSILHQKEQELQTQYLMKKSRQPKAGESRLEARMRKQQMIKASFQKDQTEKQHQIE